MVHRPRNAQSLAGAVMALMALMVLFAFACAARANVLGIHTMIQDNGDADWQLDRAAELCGWGGWVKQLMYVQDGTEWTFDDKWVRFVDGANRRHLNVVARLHYIPPGYRAGGDFASKPKAGDDGAYTAYKDLVRGFVARFGGRLHYAEIWNEPNLGLEWDGQANPEEFVKAMMAGYDGIKAADPTCRVVFPGLAPTGDNANGNMDNLLFLTRCFESAYACPRDGKTFKDHFDILGNHSYALNHPALYHQDKYSTYGFEWEWDICNRFGAPKPVLITECGYLLGNRDDGRYPAVTEDSRAQNMVVAFRDVWARDRRVLGAMPYYLHASEGYRANESGFWWVMGDGAHTKQFDTVKNLRRYLEDMPGNLADSYGNTLRFTTDDTVNTVDALAILQIALGVTPKETLEWHQLTAADVSPKDAPDGRLTVDDAVRTLRLSSGLEAAP